MYEVFVQLEFSAAHRLHQYQGNCSQCHGHNWQVTVFLEATQLTEEGMAADLRELKKKLADTLDHLDHAYLNDVPPFNRLNPTCENIAKHISDTLAQAFNNDTRCVSRVQVVEKSGSGAVYIPEP